MAYDSQRGRIVLFGGSNSITGALGDTWEWDGATWTPMASHWAGPGGRQQ